MRGETLLTLQAFERLNARQLQYDLPPFANPRNAAAGSLRALEPALTASRQLEYSAYFLLVDGKFHYDSHWESLEELSRMGFKVNTHRKKCAGLEDVLAFYKNWESKRDSLNYEIDGVVIKVDSIRSADPAGLDRQGAALGHCVQVSGASRADRG